MFFHFFKSLIFQVVRGVKGQKKSLKWQKILSITLHISETIHNMIFRYGTHVQSDNISRHFFHFFKILICWVHKEGKGTKNSPKWQKILSCAPYLRNHALYDCHLWYMCKMVISPDIFFNVSKVWFSRLPGGEKPKTSQKWQTILCVLPYISGTLYDLYLWYTFVKYGILPYDLYLWYTFVKE